MGDWNRFADPANWHPAASLYPLMSTAELDALSEDISKNDLLNPIVLIREGKLVKLLDGRNRVLALDGEFRDEDFIYWTPRTPDDSPIDYIISQNTHRRHLTASQLADVAAKVVLLMEEKEKSDPPVANLQPKERKVQTAAKMVGGVSPRSVSDAVAVRKADPVLADKVASGEVKVSKARQIVREKTEPSKSSAEFLHDASSLKEGDEVFAIANTSAHLGHSNTTLFCIPSVWRVKKLNRSWMLLTAVAGALRPTEDEFNMKDLISKREPNWMILRIATESDRQTVKQFERILSNNTDLIRRCRFQKKDTTAWDRSGCLHMLLHIK